MSWEANSIRRSSLCLFWIKQSRNWKAVDTTRIETHQRASCHDWMPCLLFAYMIQLVLFFDWFLGWIYEMGNRSFCTILFIYLFFKYKNVNLECELRQLIVIPLIPSSHEFGKILDDRHLNGNGLMNKFVIYGVWSDDFEIINIAGNRAQILKFRLGLSNGTKLMNEI